MASFLVDEDLPRGIVRALVTKGVDAKHVSDVGLRAVTDPAALSSAVAEGRAFVTADKEFGNVLTYPPEHHAGVVLIRIPETLDPTQRLERMVEALSLLTEDLRGTVVVVEPARIRFRRTNLER